MYFVGLDLAWGVRNPTGVAVVDTAGSLVHVGAAVDDDGIVEQVAPYIDHACLVGIDAPLIVNNATGRRRAEKELSADFHLFHAGAYPANTGLAAFVGGPRGGRLAERLGLDMNPYSAGRKRAIEVYPHSASVALFNLDRIVKYKRGDVHQRRSELRRLMGLIETLSERTPPLHVSNVPAWVALRDAVATATGPAQLRRAEDPVDAVLCAYTAMHFDGRPADATIYGDFETGYIVTPTLPPDLVARGVAERAAAAKKATDSRRGRTLGG
jgi:predicted RNase H-like nuclease